MLALFTHIDTFFIGYNLALFLQAGIQGNDYAEQKKRAIARLIWTLLLIGAILRYWI